VAGGRPQIVETEPVALADSELLARLFRAVGDGTRVRILELLAREGELHQMDVVRRLGASQARVSEHMSCLTWCGFATARTEGRRTFYRLAGPHVLTLLEQGRAFLDRNQAQIACCRVIDAGR
jgi:DNA-binding transcriptional ArsR family regulator